MQGILLAAGEGKRFKASLTSTDYSACDDKLLAKLPANGQAILSQSAKTLSTVLPNSIAVIQPHQTARKQCLQALGMQVIESADAALGIGHTLAAGIAASKQAEGWLIMLADMPWINANLVEAVSQQLKAPDRIAVPVYQGRRGHPVVFGAGWGSALMALTGDQGAKKLINDNPAKVDVIEWADQSILNDVDCVADLTRHG